MRQLYRLVVQGQPVWMEHAAAIDVVGMEAAGVTLEDYVFYQIRVRQQWPHQALVAQLDCVSKHVFPLLAWVLHMCAEA